MKEFVSAAKRQAEDNDVVEVKVDGDVFTCVRPAEAVLVLMAATAIDAASLLNDSSDPRRAAAAIKQVFDFLEEVLATDDVVRADDPLQRTSRALYRDRLIDRDDPLSPLGAAELIGHLVEEWGGRPTSSPSGSAAGRSSTGRSSTARKPRTR